MKESTAKKLKELNFPRTQRVTVPFLFDRAITDGLSAAFGVMDGDYKEEEVLPAPSFKELWKELPKNIVLPDGFKTKTYITLTLQDENLCYVDYIEDDNDVEYYNQYDSNITEAAAKLWIYLKEKELL